jgi:hypothetical protein
MVYEILSQVSNWWTEEHGHKVLCVLQWHCHFNPNEFVWSQVKRYYSSSIGQNGTGMEVVKKKVWE